MLIIDPLPTQPPHSSENALIPSALNMKGKRETHTQKTQQKLEEKNKNVCLCLLEVVVWVSEEKKRFLFQE